MRLQGRVASKLPRSDGGTKPEGGLITRLCGRGCASPRTRGALGGASAQSLAAAPPGAWPREHACHRPDNMSGAIFLLGSRVPLEVEGLHSLSPTLPGDHEPLGCRALVPVRW